MKLLGKGGREAAELLSKVPELAERTRKFTEMPDRFNTHLAELGWIAYDLANNGVLSSKNWCPGGVANPLGD
jgi:hypothetical protein